MKKSKRLRVVAGFGGPPWVCPRDLGVTLIVSGLIMLAGVIVALLGPGHPFADSEKGSAVS
ncbi:hypothetical protein [Kribbella sp. NPDC003557]|uniref:hypothetical protein n=1 Tax=Kribbella sp. NPDC003557 TaxID=3154449 RepID=UPI0033A70046